MKNLPYLQRTLILVSAFLCIVATPSWAQNEPNPTASNNPSISPEPEKKVPVERVQKNEKPADDKTATDEEILVLSPFEVSTTSRGYYASNSMSGTRFNTKVEDLGASITVMTKQQMSDFAMLDINDVFLYTASAEGTGTYTDLTIDRNGSVSDKVQFDPNNANRIRGLAPANISYGNYEVSGRVPIDPIDIDGLEISRGPNANVFGLGNPSGTVNQVPASASLSRTSARTGLRFDNHDGYRADLDVNEVLFKNVLGLRVSSVFQHDGFVRKPSGVNTERYNAMVKYSPFKGTTISGAYKDYRMNGNRPNFSPPRDSISYWMSNGSPTWDPYTATIHGGVDNGRTFPVNDTGLPDYFNRSVTGATRSWVFIDQSGLAYWSTPSATSSTTPNTAVTGTVANPFARFMSTTPAQGFSAGKIGAQPLFATTPSISDKSIYDWSSINLASVNRIWDRTETWMAQLDQQILNTERNTLFVQLGFFREDSKRYQRNPLGASGDNGQTGQLFVDVNERLLDGTPNPFFLRPYLAVDAPRTTLQPLRWDTYRGQLAYKLDLSKETNWLKWLGKHQFTAYDEYKYRTRRLYSFKDAVYSDNPWVLAQAAGTTRANQSAVANSGQLAASNLTRGYFRYYVGDANGNNVDYAPSDFAYGTYNYTYGNRTTGFVYEPTMINPVAVSDATGGANNQKTILKTHGAAMQSFFLDGQIVTVLGLRFDKQYSKYGSVPQLMNPDLKTLNYDSVNHWAAGDYGFGDGRTRTAGVVVRPFREIGSLKRTAEGSGFFSGLAAMLQSLALTYNRADSFLVQDPKVDVYLRPLPNPTGTGKDYGLWTSIGDKLVIRYNRFDDRQIKSRGGDASTIAQRLTRMDVASTANFLLQTQATAWVTQMNPTFTAQQIQDEVARQMQMPTATQAALVQAFNAGIIASTQDAQAKGQELEINFNPTKYWTVSVVGSELKTINSNVSPELQQFVNERLQVWTTIVDPRTGNLWWKTQYGANGGAPSSTQQTPEQNYNQFIKTPLSVVRQLDGKANPQTRHYTGKASTSFNLAGITDKPIVKNFTIGGAVRWEDKGAIGYLGVRNDPTQPTVYTDLDASQPVYDKARFYFDAFLRYQTRLFKIGSGQRSS